MEANDGRGEPDPVVVVGIVIAGTSGALAAPVGAHDALGLLGCPADRGGCQPQLKPEAMTAGELAGGDDPRHGSHTASRLSEGRARA